MLLRKQEKKLDIISKFYNWVNVNDLLALPSWSSMYTWCNVKKCFLGSKGLNLPSHVLYAHDILFFCYGSQGNDYYIALHLVSHDFV